MPGLAAAAAAGMSLLAAAAGAPPPTLAAGRRQLFFDESFLASASGVSVVMKPLHVADDAAIDAVLRPEPDRYPWEGSRFNYYHSLVDNGTHVLLYYDVLTSTGPVTGDIARATCLAISDKSLGGSFTRPNLGLVDFNGSRDNNSTPLAHSVAGFTAGSLTRCCAVVWPLNKTGHSPGTMFIDTQAPAAERFKMIALWSAPAASGTWTFTSPDGIRFTPVAHVYSGSDTQDVRAVAHSRHMHKTESS
eukprot:COSAG05_NODE_2656_length_2795_cov_2.660237_1_plen_247_part_00